MKLQYGIVGGGHGGFIGGVHRRAACFDGLAELKAGAFSRDPEANAETAALWNVSPERTYDDYHEMAEQESHRPDGVDFVSVATPNFTHYDVCRTFLEHGINVVCDKPMTVTLEEAEELVRIAREKDLLLGVSYTYSGYPILAQARKLIQGGEIGRPLSIVLRYAEDYLIDWEIPIQDGRNAWLVDPKKNGKAGCTAHIATHAEYLARYLLGRRLEKVLARFQYDLPDIAIETGVYAMLSFEGGVEGTLWSSNTAVGHHNDIAVEVLGEKGSISWKQYDATRLLIEGLSRPRQVYDASRPYLDPECRSLSRLPAGHPEGFYEAFSNVYRRFCEDLLIRKNGKSLDSFRFPTAEDGLLGMRFVEACYQSHHNGNVWTQI